MLLQLNKEEVENVARMLYSVPLRQHKTKLIESIIAFDSVKGVEKSRNMLIAEHKSLYKTKAGCRRTIRDLMTKIRLLKPSYSRYKFKPCTPAKYYKILLTEIYQQRNIDDTGSDTDEFTKNDNDLDDEHENIRDETDNENGNNLETENETENNRYENASLNQSGNANDKFQVLTTSNDQEISKNLINIIELRNRISETLSIAIKKAETLIATSAGNGSY